MIVLQTDYAIVRYDPDDYVVSVQWLKLVSSDEYKHVFTSVIEIAKKRKAKYFLSDIRKQGAVDIDEIDWLKKEVVPQALNMGLAKVALIIDDKFYTNLYASNIKSNVIKSSVPIEFFDNENSAIAWFRE